MLQDVIKAVAQLGEARTRGVLLRALALSLTLFAVLLGASWLIIDRLAETDYYWLNWFLQLGGFAGALVLSWLLFPAVAMAVLSFFADEICDAVERRHYPALAPPRRVGFGETAGEAVRFGLLTLALNLLALPLYFVFGAGLLVFLALNGYLFGREAFDAVAARRVNRAERRRLRKAWAGRTWLAGLPVAALLLVPFANLLAPAFGAILMTHRYHRWNKRALTPTPGLPQG